MTRAEILRSAGLHASAAVLEGTQKCAGVNCHKHDDCARYDPNEAQQRRGCRVAGGRLIDGYVARHRTVHLSNFDDAQVIAELHDKCAAGERTYLPETPNMGRLNPEAMYVVKSVEVHRSGLADIEFESI